METVSLTSRLTCILGIAGMLALGAVAQQTPSPVAPSTAKMAALLERIAETSGDPLETPFRSFERAKALSERMQRTQDPAQIFQLKVGLAMDLLNSGQSEDAVKMFQELSQQIG